MNKKILVLDDELSICTTLAIALEDEYDVKSTTDVAEALQWINIEHFDICLLDLRLGEYNGIDVLEKIKEIDEDVAVIIMTAYFSLESTIEAMRKGAYTYVTKPLNIEGLNLIIKQTLEHKELNETVEYLTNELKQKTEFDYEGVKIIGNSPAMRKVFAYIEKLKNVDTNVLITGESGTGKELVARAIHNQGKRCFAEFVEVNCAAIPDGLLEEELFGHRKGSFTGAMDDRKGKFAYADGGTIFLDEIGDMSYNLQAKLLRVLQEREFSPVGSNEKIKVDVRVISATNKNLKEMVDRGDFRKDLYFRLNVMEIHLPSLAERRQDIRLLIQYFIEEYNRIVGKKVIGVSKDVERKLLTYPYTGNVRELANIIEHAIVVSENETIQIEDLPEEVAGWSSGYDKDNKGIFMRDLVGKTMKEIEKEVIVETLARNNGSRKKTAEILGISEKGLRNKIKEYGIR